MLGSSFGSIAVLANTELEKRARARLWAEDPVAWAEEYLGLHVWKRQRDILYAIRDNRNTAVAAGHGVGKALWVDTPLPTPTGWTTMGEVQPGDYLLDESGFPTRVITKSEVFHKNTYRVTFSDGAELIASEDHLWNTIGFLDGKRARRSGAWTGDWRDMWDASATRNTFEISESLTHANGANSTTANHVIPINRALDTPEASLPIDPYILGAWLGDGHSSAPMMTIGDDGLYIVTEFAKRGVSLTSLKGKYSFAFTKQGYRDKLRALGVLNEKHIPNSYLRSSVAQRRELLRGVMDTDGFHIHNGTVGVDFADERLAESLAELVRSLGMKVNIRKGDSYLGSEKFGIRYRMSWTSDHNPFTKETAKWDRFAPAIMDSRRTARNIVSVELIETLPTQCVSVDSPRKLYLAGREMIPTHNTYIVAVAAAWWIDTHPIDKVFVASTAPSADQVNLLWDNIRTIHGLAKQRFKEGLVDHELPGYVTGDNKWKLDNGVIIGQGRKPPDQKSDVAFQGRHADYLLAIGDEAVGLSKGFLDALGVIATGQYNRRVIIANPTDPTSAMAKIWKEKNKSWFTMHISVMDSPRITPEEGWEEEWAPGLSGWEFVNNALNDYGSKDDPRYIARVLGEWAFDAGNNLFTAEELARAKNTHVRPDPNPVREFGVDIARMGPDSSIIYMMEEGEVWETDPDTGLPTKPTGRRGLRIRLIDKWTKAPLTGGTPDNPGSSERVHSHALAEGVRAVKIDASGMGGGVVDGLYPLNYDNYVVIEVFGGATPTDRRAYVNARAEEYFSLKKRFHAGMIDLDPVDEVLFDELLGIVYEYADKGQIKMESKDSMKKRGAKSPDHADALWYAAMDSYVFLDSPFAGLEKGDRVQVNPEDMGAEYDVNGIGMPI